MAAPPGAERTRVNRRCKAASFPCFRRPISVSIPLLTVQPLTLHPVHKAGNTTLTKATSRWTSPVNQRQPPAAPQFTLIGTPVHFLVPSVVHNQSPVKDSITRQDRANDNNQLIHSLLCSKRPWSVWRVPKPLKLHPPSCYLSITSAVFLLNHHFLGYPQQQQSRKSVNKMAPRIYLTSQVPRYSTTRRDVDPHCYGWDCLSEGGQVGVVLVIIFSFGLGWYMWRKLGQPETASSRRWSMTTCLASLPRLSRPGTPSGRPESRRMSGSIYRQSHRFSDSIHRRSQSRPISLESIMEERDRQPGESESSASPLCPSSVHIEMVKTVGGNRQPPVIPPPPGPAPMLWTAGPTPVFIHPPAYPLSFSNSGRANEIRFSSAVGQPVPFQPYPFPYQYGPGPLPPFPKGMGIPPNGLVPPPNHGNGPPATDNNPTGPSQPSAPSRPAENRRRSWFPFFHHKRPTPGHARSISESAISTLQLELSSLRLPPMEEPDVNRLRHQPSIRLIDRSPSPRQHSPRPYPRIGYRNQSPSHNLDSDSEGIHPSELSLTSVGTSMRVHDGIPRSEVSDFGRDPHLEEYSPERRRQRSLKRSGDPKRGDESDADDEEDGVRFQGRRERRSGRRRGPPSEDIQFPSPEVQRVTFAEPRRESGGGRERGRRRWEMAPAPKGNRERSGERSPERRYRDRSCERTREGSLERARRRRERSPTRQRREQSREGGASLRRYRGRSREHSPRTRHRNISPDSSDERTGTPPPRRRTQSRERDGVHHSRENHRSRNNLLGRLRAFRIEMRGERY